MFRYINLWPGFEPTTNQFNFVKEIKKLIEEEKQDNVVVNVYSVFGRPITEFDKKFMNLFFTGENTSIWKYYDNIETFNHLHGYFGFKNASFIESKSAECEVCRTPLWNSTSENKLYAIFEKLKTKSNSNIDEINELKFMSFINSADLYGERTRMLNLFAKYSKNKLTCAGRITHTECITFPLGTNDKLEFAKQYVFSLCPENSKGNGYTTEKLLEAVASGCIPVFYGNLETSPEESKLLNMDRIIQFDIRDEKSVIEMIEKVNALYEDKEKLLEMYNLPIFNDYSQIEKLNESMKLTCKKIVEKYIRDNYIMSNREIMNRIGGSNSNITNKYIFVKFDQIYRSILNFLANLKGIVGSGLTIYCIFKTIDNKDFFREFIHEEMNKMNTNLKFIQWQEQESFDIISIEHLVKALNITHGKIYIMDSSEVGNKDKIFEFLNI